jgi:hypothetical protein
MFYGKTEIRYIREIIYGKRGRISYWEMTKDTENLPINLTSFEGEQIPQLYQIPKHLRLQGREQATVKNYRQLMEKVQVLHFNHQAQLFHYLIPFSQSNFRFWIFFDKFI